MDNSQEQLKLAFIDILKGFSKAKYNSEFLYIKHNNVIDSGNIDYKKIDFESKAKERGLPTKEEKKEYLIQENLWSKERDEKIKKIQEMLHGLKNTKSKLFKKTDIEYINKEIEKYEDDLSSLQIELKELIGFTVEDYANKKINEYYMFISIFKDEYLKDRFFSIEQFEDLENIDISRLIIIYNEINEKFHQKRLKRIALSSFYLNLFNISNDNPYFLYGRPIVELSFYQMEIFGFAKYFKNIVSNSKHSPPDTYYQDPDKLIEWLESSKNAEEMIEKSNIKKKDGMVATSIVGAKKEDLAKIGADENVLSLDQIADKSGGKLSMEDLIKLHGN